MSRLRRLAVSMILAAGTMMPRSMTFKVVTLRTDADDVLADFVDVAL